MNCCVNVVSASFQQFPVNNCNNKLLRRPSGKSQIHPNFANNSIVNITTEKSYNGQELFTTFAHHQYHIIDTTTGNTGQQRQQLNATIIIWQRVPISPVWKFTSSFFTLKAFYIEEVVGQINQTSQDHPECKLDWLGEKQGWSLQTQPTSQHI